MGKRRHIFDKNEEKTDIPVTYPTLRTHFTTSENLIESLSIIRQAIHQLLKDSVESRSDAMDVAHFSDKLTHVLAQIDHLSLTPDEQAKWQFLGQYDGLTNLPNRHYFQHHVTALLATNPPQFSILFIDLDGFKEVNDTHGHKIGDLLLIETATRLKNAVRQADFVSRYGGDEFVILLPNSGIPPGQVALRILEALLEPFFFPSAIVCQISASIGIATYPDNGQSYDDLMHQADAAMYKAKKSGKNSVACI